MSTSCSDELGRPLVLPPPAAIALAEEAAKGWIEHWTLTQGESTEAPQFVPERDQHHPLGLYTPLVMPLLMLLPLVDPVLPRAWGRLAAAGEQDMRRVQALLRDAAVACGRQRYLPALKVAAEATCAQTAWWLTPDERPEVERHMRRLVTNVLTAWTLFDVIPRELFVRATGLFIGVATTYSSEDERAFEASEALAQQLNALPEQALRDAMPALQAREQELEAAVDRLTYDCYSCGFQDRWEWSGIRSRSKATWTSAARTTLPRSCGCGCQPLRSSWGTSPT